MNELTKVWVSLVHKKKKRIPLSLKKKKNSPNFTEKKQNVYLGPGWRVDNYPPFYGTYVINREFKMIDI